jgi:hypothetical protein
MGLDLELLPGLGNGWTPNGLEWDGDVVELDATQVPFY